MNEKIEIYGGNRKAFESQDNLVILLGPAGTGKTFSLCLKMHLFCIKYPGVSVLLCRKSLPSLRNSVVKTYEYILDLTGYKEQVRKLGQERPTNFIYPHSSNVVDGVVYSGVSQIHLGAIDTQGKHAMAEYDMVYINQPDCEGLTESEFLLYASRARRGYAPYMQVLSDINYGETEHWLYKGMSDKKWDFIESNFKDNPNLYNQQTDWWTDFGFENIKQLSGLPEGKIKENLFKGNWFNKHE